MTSRTEIRLCFAVCNGRKSFTIVEIVDDTNKPMFQLAQCAECGWKYIAASFYEEPPPTLVTEISDL